MELEDTLCYNCKKCIYNGGECDPRDYIDIVGFIEECDEFEELKEIDDIIKFCNGKILEDIKDTILKYDWEYRVIENDKGHYWGTDDLRDNRLNFRIRDNIVFETTIG